MSHIRDTEVTTRKPHRCFTCSEVLPPKTKMIYRVGNWEGNFSCFYLCECCEKYIDENAENFEEGFGEGEFAGETDYQQFKKQYYGV